MNGKIGDISITLPLRLCSSVSNFGNELYHIIYYPRQLTKSCAGVVQRI